MIDLRLGDCLEVMPALEAQSVDAIITDLPYETTQNAWDVIIPLKPMWAQAKRLLKSNGVFITTASQPFTSILIASNLSWFRYEWIWEKDMATGHLNAHKRPMLNHESVVVFSEGKETYIPQNTKRYDKINRRGGNGDNYGISGLRNYQEYTNYPRTIISFRVHRSNGQHPTQKPIALYEYLVRTYTNEGDIVLDFCMGSGTTGEACCRSSRNFIGIEKDEKYFAIAKERLDKVQMQQSLFV